MITVERIEQWRGEPAVANDGEQLGKVDDIYFDAGSGEPLLVSVRSGLLGRHSRLAPIEGASVTRGYLRVAYSKEQVESTTELTGDAKINAGMLKGLETSYGVTFPEEVELWSATEMEVHRAEAEAARERAEALEREAQAKLAAHEAAKQHAEGAANNAAAAEREAAEAREAALQARQQAQKYGE